VPEELFGGPDLGELAKGRFSRVIEGKLPTAEIAFLDEVFRGSSHILNTLLTIVNEKRYDSGKGLIHVPLLGVVAAANHPRLDQELEAFYDRFPIRVWVRSVFEPEGRREPADARGPVRLVRLAMEAEARRLAEAWDPDRADRLRVEERVSCTNDFRFARVYLLRKIRGSSEVSPRFKQYTQMFQFVRRKVRLSDRSFGQLWLFAAALDLVRGKDPTRDFPASDGHLRVFREIARTQEDQAYLEERYEQQVAGLHHTRNV
jgi:MoxR-like ATPase